MQKILFTSLIALTVSQGSLFSQESQKEKGSLVLPEKNRQMTKQTIFNQKTIRTFLECLVLVTMH